MWLEMLLLLERSGEAAVDAGVPSLKPAGNEKKNVTFSQRRRKDSRFGKAGERREKSS
jgi:hypothetical protein